ncbi:MAG: DNA methylase [Phycisphaeraceae bacterium]|nr:MAG: DNA methylase [Phycisphaeraceae bacterium]
MSDRPARKPPVRPGRRPPLRVFTTTLWEYPSQHYDSQSPEHKGRPVGIARATMQGDKDYVGATPSWVIWQLLQRYTREGDVVLDPMVGSGTTIDVGRDLGREPVGFDLAPSREDIAQADARDIPLDNESVDFVFLDPPYSTHVDYSDDPRCIGKLDAGEQKSTGRKRGPDEPPEPMGEAYYEAMEEVIAECHRVLKNRRYLGLYVSDSFKKQKGVKGGLFMPIGFELFSIMRDYFKPVDIVAVVRHNAKLKRGNWHKAAEEQNFFLRGFNYLFIMKKEE